MTKKYCGPQIGDLLYRPVSLARGNVATIHGVAFHETEKGDFAARIQIMEWQDYKSSTKWEIIDWKRPNANFKNIGLVAFLPGNKRDLIKNETLVFRVTGITNKQNAVFIEPATIDWEDFVKAHKFICNTLTGEEIPVTKWEVGKNVP